MSNYDFDLIIIGAGPGGYVTAARAAKMGLKTAIVEKDNWGGVCLNVGCIPTKTLLKGAKVYHYIENGDKYGIAIKDKKNIEINWKVMQDRKAGVVKGLTGGVGFLMKSNKVEQLLGVGSAIDKNTILVKTKDGKEKKYSTKYMIIATGSKVKMFDNPQGPQGLSEKDLKTNQALLTSTEILSLKEVPKTLTIIGGGVIGVEFACLFSTLGTKVTIIEYLDRILALLDEDISTTLTKILEKNGVNIITGHSVNELKNKTLTYYAAADKEHKKPLTVTSDYCLLSTGRTPITEGFTNLGIQIKPNQAFAVNNKLEALDANNNVIDNLYVIGDANGQRMLAHVASTQGLVALNNILVKEGRKDSDDQPLKEQEVDYDKMPNCIYSFPEVASVGLTEMECKSLGKEYLVKKIPFSINGKALADGETDGFVKIIIDKKYGEILGAHILCSTATDMIAEVVNIMQTEGTIVELAAACHPHPTMSEVVMDVAQDLELEWYKTNKK